MQSLKYAASKFNIIKNYNVNFKVLVKKKQSLLKHKKCNTFPENKLSPPYFFLEEEKERGVKIKCTYKNKNLTFSQVLLLQLKNASLVRNEQLFMWYFKIIYTL